jgi:hypothetical protein
MSTFPPSYELAQVFNEAQVPTVTYVTPREARQLKASLKTPGKHVTLIGASGSGKSTVAEKTLNELGLVGMKVHKFSGRSYSTENSLLSILGNEFSEAPQEETILPWLESYEAIVIDDVHHLTSNARLELAQRLKLWHEKGIKFFLIGIAKTSDQIVGADPELAIRNDVHLLEPQEVSFFETMAVQGQQALNIELAPDFLSSTIAASKGLPAIFQAICRVACVELDIEQTCEQLLPVNIELSKIGRSVVRMFDPRYFNKLVGLAQGRRQARSVHNTFFSIVESLARSNKTQVSKAELYRKIVGPIEDIDLKRRRSTSFYRAMGTIQDVINDRGLSDVLIYDSDTLTIDDPVFRFYLDHVDFERVRSIVSIRNDEYDWDVAVSFAGEDRAVVEELVAALMDSGVEVFYDLNESARLWGKDLEQELAQVYAHEARFMIVCISEYYPIKDWSRFELEVGKRSSSKRLGEYMLPLHLSSTPPLIEGLKDTIGYQRLVEHDDIERVVAIMQQKLQSGPIAQQYDAAGRASVSV